MERVLDKLDMCHLIQNFDSEEITPDMICMHSSSDFRLLGILNTCNMVRPRNECVKYGSQQPHKEQRQSGAPKYRIPKDALENLIESGFLISDIAKLLSTSQSTVNRRMRLYGLGRREFSDIQIMH